VNASERGSECESYCSINCIVISSAMTARWTFVSLFRNSHFPFR